MSNPVSSDSASGSDIIMIILAVLLPPIAVALRHGIGKSFLINLVLTILGYVPGLVHAVWVVARS